MKLEFNYLTKRINRSLNGFCVLIFSSTVRYEYRYTYSHRYIREFFSRAYRVVDSFLSLLLLTLLVFGTGSSGSRRRVLEKCSDFEMHRILAKLVTLESPDGHAPRGKL